MEEMLVRTPVPQRTVASVLAREVARDAGAVAIRSGDRALSYAEVVRAADDLARGLSALGARRQDAVLFMLDNTVDTALTWLGIQIGARVAVPVNTAYLGDMLAHVVRDSGARVAVVEGRYADRFAAIADDIPGLHTVVLRGAAAVPLPASWRTLPFEALFDPSGEAVAPPEVWEPSAIMYTSGTTGESKGVLCPHGHAFACSASYPMMEPGESFLVTLPMFHIGGLWGALYRSFIAGGTAVIPGAFSASQFWAQVNGFGCARTQLLGAAADFVWRQPPSAADREHCLKSVAIIPAPAYLDAFGERFGVQTESGYGLTEAGTICLSGAGRARPGSCGWPRDHIEARVVDENDLPLPPGKAGELVIRSTEPWSLMLGYHGRPAETLHSWRNLWLHTGDAVQQSEDGEIFFVDRQKDALRRRGENVSSFEVESHVRSCPGVADVAVVAVRSEYTEDEIKAVVVAESGELDFEAMFQQLAKRMPYFMVPRYFEQVEALPLTPTGKVKKQELRSRGITTATWDCESAGLRVTRTGVQRLARVGSPSAAPDETG